MDPQQELFTAALVAIRERGETDGWKTYDGELPGKDTRYPFAYMDSTEQTDRMTKSVIVGTVSLVVHVWHNRPTRRGELSAVMEAVKEELRRLPDGILHFECRSVRTRVLAEQPDGRSTGTQQLMHGVIMAGFTFSPANRREEDTDEQEKE